jgi:hypothetical protein
LKSIHRIPKLFDETINTYSYEKNITHVENKINDNTVSNKRIKKDVNGNIIEITTIFSNPNNSMSIFPNDHLQNKVIFDILNYDKYGNPLSILVSSIASYKDKEKNKKYERKEIITYEYY